MVFLYIPKVARVTCDPVNFGCDVLRKEILHSSIDLSYELLPPAPF